MSHIQGQYTCAQCKGTFAKSRSDEDVKAEAREDPFGFQTPPPDDPFNGEMAMICHECYISIAAWVVAHGGIENATACRKQNGMSCPHI